MSIQRGLDLVEKWKVLTADKKVNLVATLSAMLLDTVDIAKSERTLFGKDECGTGYLPGRHHEIETWYVALIVAEYLAGLLGKKVKDRHCNNHARCDIMREEHLRMLGAFKIALEKLVGEM